MSQRNFALEYVLPAWTFAEVHSLVVPDLPGRLVRRLGGSHQASEKSAGIPA